MTERSKAELDEMRRRMEAAQDKPADIDHFFRALQCQPEGEADILWDDADRRLTQFENPVYEYRHTKRPLSRRAFIRRHNRNLIAMMTAAKSVCLNDIRHLSFDRRVDADKCRALSMWEKIAESK